ncbi:MAG: NADPH-dependent glutamate synthase [Bacteroidales bacterium]|nr:NADPH-dependent glutamate synthase [Bacteroidales bacterium]
MLKDDWRRELRKSMPAKERMTIKRVVMPMEDPVERLKGNFEVNKGLSVFEALQEARRCLDCANPTCIQGCPVGVDIPTFIKYIEAGDFMKSAQVIKQSNLFPAICGRVCPQEVQCEKTCIYYDKLKKEPVAIGYLERFVADYERESGVPYIPETGRKTRIKVAVIGSGPAGLAAAGDLARYGYSVSVYEALHELGGVLRYGIPEFRLPNDIIEFEIENLKKIGVQFYTNIIIGKTLTHNDLKDIGYKAFFIGSGAGLPRFMNIPGENHVGIMSANEYLTRVNLMGAAKQNYDTPVFYGRNVAVIGGGNTAMDSVRTAKRLGAERAMIIYRRSFNEMPARKEEIMHAREEGVEFLNLNEPVEYLADENGRVNRIKLHRMELGEPDASGRRRPFPVRDSEYFLEADLVIVSIGVSPNPLISMHMPELKVTPYGTIEVCGELMKSNVEGFYAGGDIVRGGATVIAAMGDGRKAAHAIHKYLSGS